MSHTPSPSTVAARFGRRLPAVSVSPSAGVPDPAGWDDAVVIPFQEHFYVDTGIFHSLACSLKVLGLALLPLFRGHERNATIGAEVRTQARTTTLAAVSAMLLPAMDRIASPPCDLGLDLAAIETIRSELIADTQLRKRYLAQDPDARVKHGGEAELIHLAGLHQPPARIVSNDAGASAVARKRGLSTIHFLHILRAAVSSGIATCDEALDAAREGLSESGLEASERARAERADWMKTS